MFTEAFAVVASDGDDRRARQPARAERLDEPSDLRVRVRNFPIVRIAAGPGQKLRGRLVRRMRIVEVHPHEKRSVGLLVQPRHGRIHHLTARPLRFEARTLVGIAPDAIVVSVEPVGQAETTIEHVGADKSARLVTRAFQHARQRDRRRTRREHHPVLADAMSHRQHAGHDRDVRRQGQRHRAPRVVEANAGTGQRIDRGSKAATDPVSAERVDGDENDVGTDGWRG